MRFKSVDICTKHGYKGAITIASTEGPTQSSIASTNGYTPATQSLRVVSAEEVANVEPGVPSVVDYGQPPDFDVRAVLTTATSVAKRWHDKVVRHVKRDEDEGEGSRMICEDVTHGSLEKIDFMAIDVWRTLTSHLRSNLGCRLVRRRRSQSPSVKLPLL